jgi:hypothetical protein
LIAETIFLIHNLFIPFMMLFLKKGFLQMVTAVGMIALTLTNNHSLAQDTSFELWPEVDIWYKVTPGLRLSSYAGIARYLESDTRDFNLTIQADHSFGKSKKFFFTRLLDENKAGTMKTWMVRGGYMGGWSLHDKGDSYLEDMLFAEIHGRFLLKHLVLFSWRLRMDNRWLGQDTDYSYRFRYRALFEREFLSGKTSVVPYISVEPFWDSRYNLVNRVRVVGGSTVSWKSRFALEGNVTWQYDSKSSSPNVLAFCAILHLYFETAKVRENAGQK